MKERCESLNIKFNLVHGQASESERLKKDEGYLNWAHRVQNTFYRIGTKDILWQPLPRDCYDSDMFIVMQENRILSNYPLLLRGKFSKHKIAYWGHGINFQSNSPTGLREKWKQFLITKVDWWFSYTDITTQILNNCGYPIKRVTCLNNTIDTSQFRDHLSDVSIEIIKQIYYDCRLNEASQIAIFCGSLYPEKKISFLLNAGDLIHDAVPEFRLIIIGDGPQADELMQGLKTRPWSSWVGVKKGIDKAAYYKIAKIMLNPGAVGLNILDAFCAALPIFTTFSAKHGPEIAYLKEGVNGFQTNESLHEYSQAVVRLLNDKIRYRVISHNAYSSGLTYSIENMVDNFTEGILACLNSPKII